MSLKTKNKDWNPSYSFVLTEVSSESKYSKWRDFSNTDPSSSKNLIKQNSRWSKLEDVNLFRTFSSLASDFGFKLSAINLGQCKIPKSMRKFFKRVKELSEWRGTLVELKARIKKIKAAKKFTDRDLRVLRRLLKNELEGTVTMEQVLEQFPGKTLKQIVDYKRKYVTDVYKLSDYSIEWK